MNTSVIILAAGQGKRMVSDLPKVLHILGNSPLLGHVLQTVHTLSARRCVVVYGHGGDTVKAAFPDPTLLWAEQAQQLGTGHAVAQALPLLDDAGITLVLYGDVPLIRAETLQPLLNAATHGALAVLTVQLPNPTGYGRIIRDQGHVTRIVEEKDASPTERTITEVNTGIIAAPTTHLRQFVAALTNDNAQGEYYLTDVIAHAVQASMPVEAFIATQPEEVQGVNDRVQLAALERYHQHQQVLQLMRQGVTVRDPARVDIRGTVTTGYDVLIDVNVLLEGTVQIGHRVRIGPFCQIRDAVIADDVEIFAHSHIDNAQIGKGARIGPFARLRPGTVLAEDVHIGNFVETKQTQIAHGAKVNHLTYLGDAEIGAGVNVGAGTITCNYDGAHKHRTVIGEGAFIGSNSSLVAPVHIGANATIGAGSTVNGTVEADSLCFTRAPRKEIPHWPRPKKA